MLNKNYLFSPCQMLLIQVILFEIMFQSFQIIAFLIISGRLPYEKGQIQGSVLSFPFHVYFIKRVFMLQDIVCSIDFNIMGRIQNSMQSLNDQFLNDRISIYALLDLFISGQTVNPSKTKLNNKKLPEMESIMTEEKQTKKRFKTKSWIILMAHMTSTSSGRLW